MSRKPPAFRARRRRMQTPEIAERAGVSTDTVRRAFHTTDPDSFPPPLVGSRLGDSSRARFTAWDTDVEAWIQEMEQRYPV